ncbi:hypothetical protein AVEN_63392-1 [Araneus ventricosus]|uniref:Uncharacterized protein n=1 Tax=Araneus ventricosus TaxID=182803 RepID=A0A4Y2PRC1_ARAVE|nr:hypothetical protein AVEN_37795-1 [Araneus ventricosus]GBN54423.1 hypothetical protein AVEN_63392-1 [Araneus ventricosus]
MSGAQDGFRSLNRFSPNRVRGRVCPRVINCVRQFPFAGFLITALRGPKKFCGRHKRRDLEQVTSFECRDAFAMQVSSGFMAQGPGLAMLRQTYG